MKKLVLISIIYIIVCCGCSTISNILNESDFADPKVQRVLDDNNRRYYEQQKREQEIRARIYNNQQYENTTNESSTKKNNDCQSICYSKPCLAACWYCPYEVTKNCKVMGE